MCNSAVNTADAIETPIINRVNGKIYAITVEGWILILDKPSITPFPAVTIIAVTIIFC